MTNIFFLPSLPVSILCNYLFIFLMCIFPTASLFFTSYFLQQSIFLQLVPCYFITPSVSHYSLFCCEVFFQFRPISIIPENSSNNSFATKVLSPPDYFPVSTRSFTNNSCSCYVFHLQIFVLNISPS